MGLKEQGASGTSRTECQGCCSVQLILFSSPLLFFPFLSKGFHEKEKELSLVDHQRQNVLYDLHHEGNIPSSGWDDNFTAMSGAGDAGVGKHMQSGSTARTAGSNRTGLTPVPLVVAGAGVAAAVRPRAGPHRLHDRAALLLPARVARLEGLFPLTCLYSQVLYTRL